MKSIFNLALAVILASSVTVVANAQETKEKPAGAKELAAKMTGESKECCSKEGSCSKETACSKEGSCSKGECPISVAMAALPKMTYKVGEESTCCAHSAKALAENGDSPIHYVVSEKSYEDKGEAMKALVEATEAKLAAFTTPSVCEKSGTTTIAGNSCGCKHQAAKNIELVKTAVDSVKMSYKVGEETCNCPMKAKSLAQDGKEVKYVVAGEETCCELTARLNVARAKYKAAVEAVTKATAKTTPTAPEKTDAAAKS